MQIDELARQHHELSQMAAELLIAINAPEPRPVAALRWRLARALLAHLALEDSYLYPALMGSQEPSVAGVAASFREEMGQLAPMFRKYLAEWADLRIANEWPVFATETRTIISALRQRILYEDNTLYPVARAALQSISGVAAQNHTLDRGRNAA